MNRPGDEYEREADAVADAVIHGKGRADVALTARADRAQRKCDKCREEEEQLQRREASGTGPQTTVGAVAHVAGGHPLAPGVRSHMEERLGHDFGDVRVHSDSAAARAAASVNAKAYTLGRDVVFGTGQYAPETPAGMHLLAHELTHFIQQGQGGPRIAMRAPADDGGGGGQGQPQPPFSGSNFDFRPDDPPCSAAPKGLGKIAPEVDCPQATEDIGFLGRHFHFCIGSDVFASPGTPTEIVLFVRQQPAQSHFKVHGYSSTVGNAADNLRLSCHRALRVAREMMNDGVPAENIEVARHPQTDEFPGGPDANQVAVVQAIPPPSTTPARENLPFETRDQKVAIVERTKARLREGGYNLGADAYISFWTCGKVRRVSDAVDRLDVRFEGEPGLPKPEAGGQAEGLGTNVVSVSDVMLGQVNQDECVEERLVDMAFHQMTLGTIDTFDLRHQGSRFLVALGGFSGCGTPGVPVPLPADDPLGNQAAPGCAETPLATRLDPVKRQAPPAFAVTPQWLPSSGPIQWRILSDEKNRALVNIPRFPIVARADIQATGDPQTFPDYELGYMQTITEDSTVVNYVSGHTLELRVPGPILDRDRAPSRAPFFSSDFVNTPDASGQAATLMFKGTATEVPLAYEDPETGGQAQPGNVIDTITRQAHFVTWLVARRRGSSPDRVDTHFLAGQEFDFAMDVDVLGVDGEGSFTTTASDAAPGSEAVMRFGGPTPDDLGPHELTVTTKPPSRESAGSISVFQFQRILRDIIEGLDPPELGLNHSKLVVTVFLDGDTGRVALPEKNFDPVVVTSPNVPFRPREDLARAILIRIRKRDFLGRPDQPVVVERNPRLHGTPRHEPVSITLDPTPAISLLNRPGVRAAAKGLWNRTDAEPSNDPRGWVLTVFVGRNGQLQPFAPKEGEAGQYSAGPGGIMVVKFKEVCGQGAVDPANDTPLGTIHTHPDPQGLTLDDDAPSSFDFVNAREGQELCGVQFFMIDRDFVFEYDANSILSKRDRKTVLP